MECKDDVADWIEHSNVVLIETSWNVKEIEKRKKKMQATVLIETSWDVKTGALHLLNHT